MPLPQHKLGRVAGTSKVDMVIFGDSGAGKTFRAATAPGPLYVVTADVSGHKSIPFAVDGVVAHSTSVLDEVIDGFYEGGHGYKTLIIDGLSFFHDLYLKEIGYQFYKQGAKDPDLMPIQGRIKVIAKYQQMLRDAIDLTQHEDPANRVHVIFTTLADRVKEDDNAPFQIRPMLGTATMNAKFPAMFSILAFIQPGKTDPSATEYDPTRRMLFTPQYDIQARDRLGIFEPEYDEAPNLSEVFDKLENSEEAN